MDSAAIMRSHMTILNESFNEAKIAKFLKKCEIDDFSINSDGKVDIKGNFMLLMPVTQFPFPFGTVNGSFSCAGRGMITLENGPASISGRYSCANNKLKSLKGAPTIAGGHFLCGQNQLTSLVHAPREVGGEFNCRNNRLTSLEGLPEKIGNQILLTWNPNLPLLRLVGRTVFLSPGLSEISAQVEKYGEVNDILDKYREPTRSNILTCQKELIDAGYEGNASW